MEFYEAIDSLYKLDATQAGNCHYVCLECSHPTKMEWAMWRHIDNKHPDKLFELSGQAHGWNNARLGWE